VADLGLDFERARQVDVLGVRLELGQLRGRDQAGLGLRRGQRDPDAAPELAARVFAPQRAHLARGVAPGVGGLVGGVIGHAAIIASRRHRYPGN
jgi:hypothetical protein